jgi:hypothetical protein
MKLERENFALKTQLEELTRQMEVNNQDGNNEHHLSPTLSSSSVASIPLCEKGVWELLRTQKTN